MSSRPFGSLPDGTVVEKYSITHGTVELHVLTYGGIVTSLRVPDREGRSGDVVLGHAALEGYLHNEPYLGAAIGRCANRIARGRFALDGVPYQLATNDGPNHLHGGIRGFDQHLWAAMPVGGADGVGVRFTRTSPAGEEHYPAELRVAATYLVTSSSMVVIRFEAVADASTIVNLTQHSYFNLGGETSTSVLGHSIAIHADYYTPVDSSLIPTGEIAPVDGTPFDFRRPTHIADRIQESHEQLRRARGYDHNLVLAPHRRQLAAAAELFDPYSGRLLKVATTEPGLQFYSGQLLDGRVSGAYGRVFDRHAGLCLETQHFPDSPNQPAFPPITLRPGVVYSSTTTWEFTASVDEEGP